MGSHKPDATPSACDAQRPLRDLMLSLPHLQVRLEFQLDYESAEPALLYQIATNADMTMRTIHRGTAAIGRLLFAVSTDVGRDGLPAEDVAAIGTLLAALGDLAATAHTLSAGCNRYISDYAPKTPKHIPTVRP